MKFKSKIATLKSGKQVQIRVAKVKDAPAILDLKRGYIHNTTTLPLVLDEYPNNVKQETKLIKRYKKSDNSIFLVAEFNGELIGNIDLTGSKRSKIYHTAMLGMGINAGWRNQGLGAVLIAHALDWAKAQSPIKIVWLDVYASNSLGVNLYTKMGFKTSGSIPEFFKEEDAYINKIQMYKKIS